MIDDILDRLRTWVDWIGTASSDAAAWLVDRARGIVELVDDGLSAADAADWLLLALAVGLVWYVVRRIRSAGVLGTVKITDLQADGDEENEKLGLSADLRTELSSKGLLSAPVPAGSPAGTVIAAVAASPVAQAGWLGKILETVQAMLPRPREYDAAGTLRSRCADEAEKAGEPGCVHGITYTLSAQGRPPVNVIETVWEADYPNAVRATAAAMYMHVSTSDPLVFPRWSQWWKPEAFTDYVAGLTSEAQVADDTAQSMEALDDAVGHFDAATLKQPANRLPANRAANLRETKAALTDPEQRQLLEAQALGAYIAIIKDVPTLAEARYRSSVLFAALKPSGDRPDYPAEVKDELRRHMKLVSAADAETMWTQAKFESLSESRKTRNLLRWWGIPLTTGRLRTRFEPRGRDRRQFLKAVKISHRCIRKRVDKKRPWDRTAVRLVFRWQWNSAGWQAHYNAACFYSLRKEMGEAFAHLERAVDDPASGVTGLWMERDPDLKNLPRETRWNEIAARLAHAGTPSRRD